MVAPGSLTPFTALQAARMAVTSAWAVASEACQTRLCSHAMTFSSRTMQAPKGDWPAAAPSRARAMAIRMYAASFIGVLYLMAKDAETVRRRVTGPGCAAMASLGSGFWAWLM